MWTYRIDLGPSWVRCRVVGEDVVIPFADLSAYLEYPLRFQGSGFGGYQFILEDIHGQKIHFSTQIVGWAALHEALHAARPELIPRATNTAARSRVGIGKVPMPVIATMLTAAGQDIPEEWNHPTRERWYDAVIGYALGLGTAGVLAMVAVRPLMSVLKGWGVPFLLYFFPPLLLIIWLAMYVTQLYVTVARRTRMSRASQLSKRRTFTDQDKNKFVDSIATILSTQLTVTGGTSIDDDQGAVNRRALGYIYGFIDAALRIRGQDMADIEVGMPITFQVLRRLFPGKERQYLGLLAGALRSDPVVMATIQEGGQQYLDWINGKLAAPMGLARAILESK